MRGSLVEHLDATQTAFGKRTFRKWLARPLLLLEDINPRLAGVFLLN